MSTSNLAQDLPDLYDITTKHFVDHFDSLGEPTMFSPYQLPPGFTTTESPAGLPTGTVSPTDLMMDASAPPSTSFTDLSTPSFESPGLFSNDTSPMFASDHDLGPGHEEWDSLFSPADSFGISEDVGASFAALPKSGLVASPMIRSASSPGQSSGSPSDRSSRKHSSVAGVNARRRDKPLPPIAIDTSDPVAVKRARNTEAARKSRARKLERNDAMESRIAELEKSLEEAQRNEAYWKAMALRTQQP